MLAETYRPGCHVRQAPEYPICIYHAAVLVLSNKFLEALGVGMPARSEEMRQPVNRKRYSANMEDYLEAIRTLSVGDGPVTVTQLSDMLNVSKPSVTAAVAKLAADGLVVHEKYGAIQLSARGRVVAEDVWHRHEMLKMFLMEILGVPAETAEQDACKLEHYLSQDSSRRLTRFIDYVLNDDRGKPAWLEVFMAEVSGRATVRV